LPFGKTDVQIIISALSCERLFRPMSGKVDWQVIDQLPAIHGTQFFCDAMTAVGREHPLRQFP
jgi:hypothetical protein